MSMAMATSALRCVGAQGSAGRRQGCRRLPEPRGEGGQRVPTAEPGRMLRRSLHNEQLNQNWYGQDDNNFTKTRKIKLLGAILFVDHFN
jgi:hypothetical protein